MTRIKDATWESGTVTGTNGVDSAVSTISIDNTSKIKGTYTVLTDALGEQAQEDFTAENEVFVSVYVYVGALPATGQSRVVFIKNSTTNIGSLRITSAGKVQLRDNGSTQIGSDSATVLSVNNVYRLGIHYLKGAGASSDTLDGYVATGDNAFGAAFATSSVVNSQNQANRVEVGQASGGTVATLYFDDLRIDNASMPGPSTATTYNQAVDVSVTGTSSKLLQASKALAYTATSTIARIKAIAHAAILLTSTTSITKTQQVNKSTSYTSNASVVRTAANTFTKLLSYTGSIQSSLQKQIVGLFSYTVPIQATIQKQLAQIYSYGTTATTSLQKQIARSLNYTLSLTTEELHTFLYLLSFTYTLASTTIRSNAIHKALAYTSTTVYTLTKRIQQVYTYTYGMAIDFATDIYTGGIHYTQDIAVAVSSTVQYGIQRILSSIQSYTVNSSSSLNKSPRLIHTFTVSTQSTIVKAMRIRRAIVVNGILLVTQIIKRASFALNRAIRLFTTKDTQTRSMKGKDDDSIRW